MSMITQVETEISLAWAEQNPDKFLDAVAEFRENYAGWGLKVSYPRAGFVILAARREPVEPLDLHVMSDHVRLSQINFLLEALVQDHDIGLTPNKIIEKAHELARKEEQKS